MKISCLDKEVGKLLGESFYKIPRFQRPYSWDQTNLEEFWNDTVLDNQSGYFIGNFVAYEDGDALGVVDGQQRLTTITLLLCALRDAMKEEDFPDLATGIHQLIERPNIRNEKFYVLRPETSYPFFQEYVQKFSRLLKPSNKGVDLAKDKWIKIAETFEESQADLSVSTFIHHFWLSRYDYVTEKKLYKALRKQIKKDNAEVFLDDLLLESSIYRQIHEPAYKRWKKDDFEIRDSLNAMNVFRIKQQLPMVLAVMRHHADGTLKHKYVKQILSAIENFHFAFTAIASQRSSGGISFMYASAAKNLYEAESAGKKGKVLKGLRKKLRSKLPPYQEFEARFLELRYSSKFTKQRNLVRYILGNLCEHYSSGVSLDHERMTIEHLAPENPAKPNGLTDEQIASIGNLLFVDQELNEKLENKTFPEKKKILTKADVWVDDQIKNASDWGQAEIQARAKFLADKSFTEVWG
jgi:hypothetical protein